MSQSSGVPAELAYLNSAPEQADVEMVFVPVFQGDDDLGDVAGVDAAAGGEIARARAAGEFRGKPYEFFITPVRDHRWKCARIALEAKLYLLGEEGALATRIEGAAIFTSTSSIGFFVQACVT